jgi:hypothetical protein
MTEIAIAAIRSSINALSSETEQEERIIYMAYERRK